jgi:hypothetical protein
VEWLKVKVLSSNSSTTHTQKKYIWDYDPKAFLLSSENRVLSKIRQAQLSRGWARACCPSFVGSITSRVVVQASLGIK